MGRQKSSIRPDALLHEIENTAAVVFLTANRLAIGKGLIFL
jgi:hypothetical protein